jgi:hypothetical protein
MVMATVPAQAQIAGARELVAGEVATGAPTKAVKPDIYYFTGEAGAKLTFALSSKAATRLVLYTPAGEEMLTAGGDTGATLEAVLPFNEVYTLAVIRRDATQPYALFMTATQPTLGEALLATGVGYERLIGGGKRDRQCWVKPGVMLRVTYPDAAAPGDAQTYEAALAPDRETTSITFRYRNGNTASYIERYRVEGAEYVQSYEYSNGQKIEKRRALAPEIFSIGSPAPRFTGYHCDP